MTTNLLRPTGWVILFWNLYCLCIATRASSQLASPKCASKNISFMLARDRKCFTQV